MKALPALLILLSFCPPALAAQDECVVLLHGLGRTAHSMSKLERRLEQSGYIVRNEGYPSRDRKIEDLAEVVGRGIAHCREQHASKIHFVTHSLGGILVRQYFQDHEALPSTRVVMLGPPNHGSEITDLHKDAWWYRKVTGPAGQQLGTGPDSVPNRLGPVRLEIGVIAGTGAHDLFFSSDFKTENDGKVSVESAKLKEMKDFIVVDNGHTFIMSSDGVIRQVMFFLREGRFDHNGEAPALSASRPTGSAGR